MSQIIDKQSISMTPYVLVVAGSMVIVALAWLALQLAGLDIVNSSGHITTLISIFAGVLSFAYRVDRPMNGGERLWFAAGVMLVNAIIPVVFVVVAILVSGLSFTFETVDESLLGGQGYIFEGGLWFVVLFTLLVASVEAYFFSWLMTRKLPRKHRR